eukprot:c22530_g1_i1 orf=1232-2428(+)
MSPRKRCSGVVGRRSGIMRTGLAPLMEGPTPEGHEKDLRKDRSAASIGQWMKWQLEKNSWPSAGQKRSDPRLLLGVLGCPLAPVAVSTEPLPHLSIKDVPIEASSAQYIVQQYSAATGGSKLHSGIRNSYTMGKVRMLTSEVETASRVTRNPIKAAENGWFVLWQMMPDKWSVELAIEDSSVQAGSNGKTVWRYTPWLGAHAAKGPVRPLRRALQGLDPMTTASMFITAHCIGEKKIGEEDCFILKLTADPSTLAARSDGPAEIIRHVLFGYFSQRTGLLVYLEDSHLTRVQANGTEAIYWETTIESALEDYKYVDGINIPHAGHSVVTLFRFGEEAMNHTKTRMEETWNIEEVAFNVPGLSEDFFIPPAEIRQGNATDVLQQKEKPLDAQVCNELEK